MATLTAARKRAAFDDLPAPRLCEHVAELGVEASGRKSKQDLVSALEGCFRGALVQLKRDETGFTRYFYKPQPLRSLEAIRADIVAFEKETEGLVGEIVGGGTW